MSKDSFGRLLKQNNSIFVDPLLQQKDKEQKIQFIYLIGNV
jgi:hypothetical protein